jgi:hypothetical protein
MKRIFANAFPRGITKDQCRDTGMAMVLLLLILNLVLKRQPWLIGAIAALVLNMTWPQMYRPVAVVWLGLAHVMGGIVSRILLSVLFFGLVTPVGVLRRLLGKDPMRLKAFKASGESVMVERNHTFTGQDIRLPY